MSQLSHHSNCVYVHLQIDVSWKTDDRGRYSPRSSLSNPREASDANITQKAISMKTRPHAVHRNGELHAKDASTAFISHFGRELRGRRALIGSI